MPRIPGVLLALALIALPLSVRPLGAQQAPADTAAVLHGLAVELEAEGRGPLAESLFRLILSRYPDSPAADLVRARMAARPPAIDRTGRVELLVWSTLYGLWLGVAVPASLGADDDPAPFGLGLLLGGPAGFLTARAYTADRSMGEGDARAITFGGTWGTWQGFGWGEVLDLGEDPLGNCFVDPYDGQRFCDGGGRSHESVFASMILGGLAGITAGAVVAERSDITHGTAALVNFGSLWGTWYGFAASELLDIGDELDPQGSGDSDAQLAWTLLGGNAGLLAMALLAPKWDMSVERARLISIAGVAGLLGGAGLDLLFQPDDEDIALLVPVMTSLAGLGAGAVWTKGRDRRSPAAPGRGALLEVDDGRFAFDVPLPTPTLLRTEYAGGRVRAEPAMRLTLLNARF